MARIVYALSGQGRGHTSRVLAMSALLRERGHEVLFCGGGTAKDVLTSLGEPFVRVPALRQVMDGNEVQVVRTLCRNRRHILNQDDIVTRLADTFRDVGPDLLITDFEAFAPRAADRLGLPVLSFNHQEVVTETRYRLPIRYWPTAALTQAAIKLIAPSRPAHTLVTSFYFPPLRRPDTTTLVPPIIRTEVQALTTEVGDHILVYFNQTDGAEYVLDELRKVDASFIVYNFPVPAQPERYPNLTFKQPSLDGFLADLASSRGVLCTAGFTLISEALFLSKPLLVVPNRGIFEQTLNALFLQRDGLGYAVVDRSLTADDIRAYLDQMPTYAARLRGRNACGNKEALACIERVLASLTPPAHPRPALALESSASLSSPKMD